MLRRTICYNLLGEVKLQLELLRYEKIGRCGDRQVDIELCVRIYKKSAARCVRRESDYSLGRRLFKPLPIIMWVLSSV
jgi:hypothetical protein